MLAATVDVPIAVFSWMICVATQTIPPHPQWCRTFFHKIPQTVEIYNLWISELHYWYIIKMVVRTINFVIPPSYNQVADVAIKLKTVVSKSRASSWVFSYHVALFTANINVLKGPKDCLEANPLKPTHLLFDFLNSLFILLLKMCTVHDKYFEP